MLLYQPQTQAWVWREETKHLECAGSFCAKGVVKGWVHSKHTNTNTCRHTHGSISVTHQRHDDCDQQWSRLTTPFPPKKIIEKKKFQKKQKLDLKHLGFNQTASRSKDVSTAGVFRDGLDFFFSFHGVKWKTFTSCLQMWWMWRTSSPELYHRRGHFSATAVM